MGKVFPSIEPHLQEFILQQAVFFVASAPLVGSHINVSPKGLPARSFAILDANTVAYLDSTGSGCETISHLYENGRATIMFASFGTSPKIMRLFCRGKVFEKGNRAFEQVKARMGEGKSLSGVRAVILLDVFQVTTSCGFGVPLLGKGGAPSTKSDIEPETTFTNRDTLEKATTKMEKKQVLIPYQRTNNCRSLDGLPGLRSARKARGQWMLAEDLEIWIRRVFRQWDSVIVGMLLGFAAVYLLKLVEILSYSGRHPETLSSDA